MKTKILFLAMALIASSLMFAQTVNHESETDADKKVLRKIKKKMMYLNVKDYLEEGERQAVVITAVVNENNTVEVLKISGMDEELNEAIVETFKEHPVRYADNSTSEQFTFKVVLEHRPA